jgi:hypothetical protein
VLCGSTTYYTKPYPYRLMVVLFSWVVTLLELFFKNQGSNCEIMDCGLILEKHRGIFAKMLRIIDFRIIFKEKAVDSVHRLRTTFGLGPRWIGHGQRHRAHRRAAGTALWLTDAGGSQKIGGGYDKPAWDLTREQKAARRLGDGCEAEGGESSGAQSLGARNWGKEERGRSGGRRGCQGAFL